MPGVHKRRDYFISDTNSEKILSANSISEREKQQEDAKDIPVSYCQICQEWGFNNLLHERLYTKSELINGQKPSDWANWLQCENGHLTAVVHAKQESSITGIKEPDSNIYDPKKVFIEHFVEPRKNRTNKPSRIRGNPEEDDPDVQQKVQNGAKLVSYHSQ